MANPLDVLKGVVIPPLLIRAWTGHLLATDAEDVPLVIDVAQQRAPFGLITLGKNKQINMEQIEGYFIWG